MRRCILALLLLLTGVLTFLAGLLTGSGSLQAGRVVVATVSQQPAGDARAGATAPEAPAPGDDEEEPAPEDPEEQQGAAGEGDEGEEQQGAAGDGDEGEEAPAPRATPPRSTLKPPCEYNPAHGVDTSARSEVPCLPPADVWPWATKTAWRSALGDRVVAAIRPSITDAACDGLLYFGQQAWCRKAFGAKGVLGLSFGIGERDVWSERLSGDFRVPTRLYDCIIDPEVSPPMSGDASNGTGDCDPQSAHCYLVPYQAFRVCLGPEAAEIEGRPYRSLAAQLRGRGPLSVHLKIDAQGSEWAVLKDLLESGSDLRKIRSLDVELYLGSIFKTDTAREQLPEEARLEEQVKVMEGLRQHFAVVGSTLEDSRQGWRPWQDCPEQQCGEPAVHTSGGFGLLQFAVSYVSRRALAQGAGHGPAEPAADVGAPVAVPSKSPPCEYHNHGTLSSRPGVPCLPAAEVWPYKTNTPWRTALGDRIVASATPVVTEQDCEGFELFGDQTWCLKALQTPGSLGLSFGIEERDLWSEKMSSLFRVPTQLFDCFIEPEKSPPIAGTAPNGTGPCDKNGGHCYEVPYQSFRICLGPRRTVVDGRKYDTLTSRLSGRGPLSTHLKIDVEGSEWTVLEQLLDNEDDMGKVRTLDMEVHFGFTPASDGEARGTEQERLERQVEVMERLQRRFWVTGSTLEEYRQGWRPTQDCPQQQCHEPVVHTSGGFSPQQFAVSYVSRDLVSVQPKRSLASLAAAPGARDPRPKYGFYLHARDFPAAVAQQVRKVKEFFLGPDGLGRE